MWGPRNDDESRHLGHLEHASRGHVLDWTAGTGTVPVHMRDNQAQPYADQQRRLLQQYARTDQQGVMHAYHTGDFLGFAFLGFYGARAVVL